MNFFDAIIKRAVNFSVQSYTENKNDVIHFFEQDDLFQLSILVSSNSLFHDVKKKKTEKIETSLAKYYTRAHFKPTPFGLFSSVGVVNWGTATQLSKSKKISLSVTHDNLFLSLQKEKQIMENWTLFQYSINPSMHFVGEEKIGFYNSKPKINDKIEINFVELDYDEDLKWLLEQFKSKPDMSSLINALLEQGFEKEDVEDYLLQLIDTGLLIENFMFNPYAKKLENKQMPYLSDLISKGNFQLNSAEDIKSFNNQYLHEQNLFFGEIGSERFSHSINSFEMQSGQLNADIKSSVKKYIDFVLTYNFNTKPVTGKINEFIAKVSEHYNDGFIPLNTIFNPYSGITYFDDNSDYILKLHQDIFCKVIASSETELVLDLPIADDIAEKRKSLPLTFSVLVEVLKCKKTGKEITYMQAFAGGSALNVISRFSEVNKELCQQITNFEKEFHKDKILADINCVGNFRSINIAPKKQLYDFCIPLNTSNTASKNPVFVSDIYMHLQGDKFRLVSKEYQKEIIPKKVSAVNPKVSESDLYKFLCDLELYNQEIYAISFDFNTYACFKDYIPRIYLDEAILLSPAQLLLVNSNYSFEEFKAYFFERLLKFQFTQTVNFYYLKGNSIIDTSKDNELRIIYDSLKTRDYFYISENIYEHFDPIVEDDSGNYAHELIISVKNTSYEPNEFSNSGVVIENCSSPRVPIVSEWIYFEVYCNSFADNDILKGIYSELYLQKRFSNFFFVHYDTNGRVLRLRFRTDSIDNKKAVLRFVDGLKQKNIIKKYHLLPYEPETFRYGGEELMACAEYIFNLDTIDLIENVTLQDLSKDDSNIVSVLKIINYLELMGFSKDQMIDFCENAVQKFSKEFELNADLRKSFNEDYAKIRFKISDYRYESFVNTESLKNRLSENLKQNTIPNNAYAWLIIHMSMNRHFNENQRFNEFRCYYLAKNYLNQLKFKNRLN
ncbi:thiopeptide-type bacteriocin biosynthesis protein [Flavobacterium sp.]|uniref:thiopeptide-type bacteriocin biosynthesis protein n=1 Tax=Flavobacterium sp. TaxID=239 RepID=UPI0031DCDE26